MACRSDYTLSALTALSMMQPSTFLWHQAFDTDYLLCYYYCQFTRETRWEPPDTGFVPISRDQLRWHTALEIRHNDFQAVLEVHDDETAASKYGQNLPLQKYWIQRSRLLFLQNHGVHLDGEAWFSVTPERLAYHQARRCWFSLHETRRTLFSDVEESVKSEGSHHQLNVLDAFSGAGGNSIAFGRCEGVNILALDNNIARLKLAAHNSEVYGVRDSIDFICGDVVSAFTSSAQRTRLCRTHFRRNQQLAQSFFDIVFLSPPWGGPEYNSTETYDLRCISISGHKFLDFLELVVTICPNVAVFLPRNTDLCSLLALVTCDQSRPRYPFEAEKNYINGKLKSITLYFGGLFL